MQPRFRPDDLLALTGAALGAAALWAGLPGGVMSALLLPFASAAIGGLTRALLDGPGAPRPGAEARVVYDAMLFRFAAFVLGMHAAILLGLLGVLWGRAWTARLVPFMLGLLLMGIGNLLPRTRPNVAIGIRTARTVADRACWLRTHRRAGHVIVGAGFVLTLSALIVPAPIGPRMILAVAPVTMAGLALLTLHAGRRVEA